MGLRAQLLLVSLCLLLLPWGGCQYVQEMENVLRETHSQAMEGQTTLLARMLDQALILPPPPTEPVFYTPLRYQPVELDGYDDDWSGQPVTALNGTGPLGAGLRQGLFGPDLYLFLRVKSPHLRYHHPGQSYRDCDHVRLVTGDGEHQTAWLLFTSAPGQLQVFEQQDNNRILHPAPAVDAWWQETAAGYDLEIRIPRARLGTTFDVQVYAGDSNTDVPALSTRQNGQPSLWRQPMPELGPLLQPWRTRDADITLVDTAGWPLAPQKDWLNASVEDPQPVPSLGLLDQAINRFYRFAVEQLSPVTDSPVWPLSTQPLSSQKTRIPLERLGPINQPHATWYRWPGTHRSALLVVLPLHQDGQLRGYLLYSQTGQALRSLTNNALRRVSDRVLLVLVIVVLVLILYASLLSWRIRRLKQQAEAAISADGKVDAFTPSRRRDEIGDLSRSYHQLLQRVRNYTSYLETLGGKLAHELRTPLAIVKSSLELAQASPDNSEYLQRAQAGSERLRQILSAMSEASRVEQTIQQAEFQRFDLAALVRDMSRAYGDTYPTHRFQGRAPDQPAWVTGSPELMAQLLDKLVDNARDFAPQDSLIELELVPSKNKWLLNVSNSGPALPSNLDGQLFDSLVSQREGVRKGDVPHLGLGLYIVRLIAQAHQGQVEARNRSDHSGVIFTVALPAEGANPANSAYS